MHKLPIEKSKGPWKKGKKGDFTQAVNHVKKTEVGQFISFAKKKGYTAKQLSNNDVLWDNLVEEFGHEPAREDVVEQMTKGNYSKLGRGDEIEENKTIKLGDTVKTKKGKGHVTEISKNGMYKVMIHGTGGSIWNSPASETKLI